MKQSARRLKSNQPIGLQALQKKLDNPAKNKYYVGLQKNMATVDGIIDEVYSHPKPKFDKGVDRSGQPYVEIFNPDTGRGIRVHRHNGEFLTLVNMD